MVTHESWFHVCFTLTSGPPNKHNVPDWPDEYEHNCSLLILLYMSSNVIAQDDYHSGPIPRISPHSQPSFSNHHQRWGFWECMGTCVHRATTTIAPFDDYYILPSVKSVLGSNAYFFLQCKSFLHFTHTCVSPCCIISVWWDIRTLYWSVCDHVPLSWQLKEPMEKLMGGGGLVLTYSCYHTDRGAKGEGREGGREGWKVVGGQERRGRGRVGRNRRTIYSSQTICSKGM